MRPARRIAAILFLAGVASGQTFSAHSGFTFSDTLETATDILVADILDGSGFDNGSQVAVNAKIRAVRVLRGGITPDSAIALEWRYQPAPFEGPAASAKVPAIRALWFLRKRGAGFEPLQVSVIAPFGGFFLEVPATPVAYLPDLAWQSKIAREAGSAAEDLFARHAGDFGPHRPEPPRSGVLAPWVRSRMQVESVLGVLDALPSTATADVYRAFSRSADSNLKLLGLTGRIGAGDTDAILELEKDLPFLAQTFTAMRASQHIMGIQLGKNLPAAHALGRMALSEATIPGVEGAFAMQVAATRSAEFVPYLIAMLDSPNPSTRGGALMAFCNLLGPAWDQRSKPQGLWDPGMAAYCPSGAPMSDREQERRDIQFWKQWWESHRAQIGKTTNLPVVVVPARYNAPQAFQQITEIPLEVRFQGLLSMVSAQATHYHSETGAIVEGPPPSRDPIAALLEGPDRGVWREIIQTTTAKLEENRRRAMEVMNAARLQGSMPQREKLQSLEQERQGIIKAALQDLQNRMSPEGWGNVERFLKNTGGAVMMMAAPPQ